MSIITAQSAAERAKGPILSCQIKKFQNSSEHDEHLFLSNLAKVVFVCQKSIKENERLDNRAREFDNIHKIIS